MIKFFSILSLLLAVSANAATTVYPDKGGVAINLLDNNQFRQGKSRWTASGGTFSIVTGASALDGSASASWTPSASSQTLKSAAVTVPLGLQGRSCSAKILYKTSEATNIYLLRVYDGSANLLNSSPLTGSPVAQEGRAIFPCPASGTLRLSVEAPSGGAPTNPVVFTNTHLGSLTTQLVSQAQWMGTSSWAMSTNTWTIASPTTSYQNFPANGSISAPTLAGSFTAPGTSVPEVIIPNAAQGTYYVVANGLFYNNNMGNYGDFTISDGTTNGGDNTTIASGTSPLGQVVGTFTYASAQTNLTFQIQGKAAGSSASVQIGGGQSGQTLNISVFFYPSSTSIALTSDQTAASWSGSLAGASSWSTVGAVTNSDFSSQSGTLTQRQNTNLGTVTQASGGLPGITFTPPKAGKFKICAQFVYQTSSVAGIQGLRLFDGTTELASYNALNGTTTFTPVSICGEYAAASVSPATVKLQGTNSLNTTLSIGGGGLIDWSILQEEAGQPAPLLVGNVTSQSAGSERMERVSVNSTCSSSPCTISSQSGAWVTSVTRSSTGLYTVNFNSNEFSAAPTCTVLTVAAVQSTMQTLPTTSAISIQLASASGTATDGGFDMLCMGPR